MVWNKTNNFGAGMLEKYILFSDIPVCNLCVWTEWFQKLFVFVCVFVYCFKPEFQKL